MENISDLLLSDVLFRFSFQYMDFFSNAQITVLCPSNCLMSPLLFDINESFLILTFQSVLFFSLFKKDKKLISLFLFI